MRWVLIGLGVLVVVGIVANALVHGSRDADRDPDTPE